MKHSGRPSIAFFFFLLCNAPALMAQLVLGTWQIRHPHPTDYPRSIAHDGEKYVLVDGYGHIYTSVSGRNWEVQPTPGIRPLSGVVFGLDKFVAVGASGSILTSTNGTNWILRLSPTTNDLSKVIFAQDQFVAVGSSGTIITSTNGTEFTLNETGVTNYLRDIAPGPGTLVAAGEASMILVSTNRGEWKKALVTSTNDLRTVAYFNGRYDAGWFSTADPMVWTNNAPQGPHGFIGSIAAASNAIARLKNGWFEISNDGLSWRTNKAIAQGSRWIQVIDDRFYVMGRGIYFGDTRHISFSQRRYSLGEGGSARYHWKIAATTNGYMAFGAPGYEYFVSTNAQSWEAKPELDSALDTSDLLFASLPYAKVDGVGRLDANVVVSDDGKEWKTIRRPESGLYHAAALGSNIVVSGRSNLWITTDRTNWTKLLTKQGPLVAVYETSEWFTWEYQPWITSINVKSNLLAATTEWGEVLLSTNGLNWEFHQTPFFGLRDCTFTPSGILVISWDMIAEANFDNAPHSEMPAAFDFTANAIKFSGPVGYYELQSSSNLSNWTTFQATTTNVNFQMPLTNSQHYFRAFAPY